MSDYDSLKTYCRKLGHHLTFQYCRSVSQGLPCSQILNCWFEKIPVENYLRKNFRPEEWEAIFAPPKAKISTIMEIMNRIKEA